MNLSRISLVLFISVSLFFCTCLANKYYEYITRIKGLINFSYTANRSIPLFLESALRLTGFRYNTELN